MDFKVICINDKYKPEGFIGDWIVKGEVYTVIESVKLIRQRKVDGYKLMEKNIHPKLEIYCKNCRSGCIPSHLFCVKCNGEFIFK